MSTDALDPVIHAPARLRIVATLAALPNGDTLSFTRLQDILALTPGNLITHLRKLEDAGYLTSETTGNGRGSRTSIALTRPGPRRTRHLHRGAPGPARRAVDQETRRIQGTRLNDVSGPQSLANAERDRLPLIAMTASRIRQPKSRALAVMVANAPRHRTTRRRAYEEGLLSRSPREPRDPLPYTSGVRLLYYSAVLTVSLTARCSVG